MSILNSCSGFLGNYFPLDSKKFSLLWRRCVCLVPRVVSKENRFSCNLMQITTNCTFQHSGGQETPCVLSFFQFSIFNLRADINRHRKERSGSIRGRQSVRWGQITAIGCCYQTLLSERSCNIVSTFSGTNIRNMLKAQEKQKLSLKQWSYFP